MIELTINDKKVTAKKGETVLEVCRREGIYIPTLCYQENLTPYGGCRLCIVEVEGSARPMTACTLPVHNGMVVKTATPELRELRRFTLQLILSEHPYSCLICDKTKDCANYMECIEKEPITFGCKYCSKNGDCELQKLVEEFEIKTIPFAFHYRNIPVEDYDPFFERDYNLCILCGRCVRACAELRNAYVIDFHHRGPRTLVGTAFNRPHIDASCQFCGACVDACPTGAMRERYNKYFDKGDSKTKTYCMLCSMGCAINVETAKGKAIRVVPDSEPLCVRGRFGIAPLVNHSQRITYPILKKDGRLVEVDWHEALEFVAKIFDEYKGKTGIIFTPDLTLEAINSLSTVAEIMGVEDFGVEINTSGSFPEVCIDKKEKKVALIVINTDLISDFPVFILKLKEFFSEPPVIILIDPVQTRTADIADIWLKPNPGHESDLLNLLLSSEQIGDFAGVKKRDIIEARKLLVRRDICVLYNPKNMQKIPVKEGLTCFPLVSSLNHSFLTNANMPRVRDILQNDKIACLYLIGASVPANKKYERVIVQDCFLPDFDFDVFLPSCTFIEAEGKFIDFAGKEKKVTRVIEPIGNSKPDDWIISSITERLDFEVDKNLSRSNSTKQKPTTTSEISKEYPFYLIVRENSFKFRNKLLSQILKGFMRIHPDTCLWMHPDDATRLNIRDGDQAKVVTRDYETLMNLMTTERVPCGLVFAFYNPVKNLTESTAVRIEAISERG